MGAVRSSRLPHPDLEEVLFTDRQIRRRIKSLAREIKAVYGQNLEALYERG